jgi:phosphoglycerate dehydrogenase-like enzyme
LDTRTEAEVARAVARLLPTVRVVVHESLTPDLLDVLSQVTGRPVCRTVPGEGPVVYVGPDRPRLDNQLLWLHSTNAGVDAVLRQAPWPSGTLLTRTVGRMGERMAQYVLAWLLAEAQDVPAFLEQHGDRAWRRRTTELVVGGTAVVFGAGAIGSAIARLLGACGLRTVGVASRARAIPGFDRVVTVAEVTDLLPTARWVISTLPLTPATEGFFDTERFAAMSGATFVNVGRGPTVDMAALASALADGSVGRAVLDVLPDEPPDVDAACWTLPRTVVTSHSAGVTGEEDVANDFTACWQALCTGRRPPLTVLTARGY